MSGAGTTNPYGPVITAILICNLCHVWSETLLRLYPVYCQADLQVMTETMIH